MIDSLPVELILEFLELIDEKSLLSLAHVNTKFRQIIKSEASKRLTMKSKDALVQLNRNIEGKQPQNLNEIIFDYILQELLDNGSSTRYVGIRRKGDRVVKSRYPLVLHPEIISGVDSGLLYFEVTILSQMDRAMPLRIGLVGQDYSNEHPPGSLKGSVGYVSTDGYIGLASEYEELFQFASPWGEGDVVGCGYSRNATENGTVFFTLNGQWVGDSPYKISEKLIEYRRTWHAAFSSCGETTVKFNFGASPFMYNLQKSHLIARLKPIELSKQIVIERPRMIPNVLPLKSDPFLAPIVQSDGYSIQFPSHEFPNMPVSRSVQSNIPIAMLNSSRYFEVHILSCINPRNTFISIGLASNPYSPFHHIGWDFASIGFHRYNFNLHSSDDGKLYQSSHQAGESFAEQFSVGSIIGCGYFPETKQVYFTINGTFVNRLIPYDCENMYPSIAANHDWHIYVNLGQSPFEYLKANIK